MNKLKIAVLYGGESSERKISLVTGENVAHALAEDGHDVDLIDIAKKELLYNLHSKDYDIAYLALHGKGGEDGTLQGFLETSHIPYTGSNVLASATAMNKASSKIVYSFNGLPTSPFCIFHKGEEINYDSIIEKYGDHLVVKAANEGSSIGLYIVSNKKELIEAIAKAFTYDKELVIEKYINGNEFTVAVLEFPEKEINKYKDLNFINNSAALPVIQIIPKNDFYDLESKYDKGGSKHICPANISADLSDKMRAAALKAHIALGCSGISRTDFIVDNDNNPWILETNNLPGMTKTSLVPDSAKSIGIDFNKVCEYIVKAGFNK